MADPRPQGAQFAESLDNDFSELYQPTKCNGFVIATRSVDGKARHPRCRNRAAKTLCDPADLCKLVTANSHPRRFRDQH